MRQLFTTIALLGLCSVLTAPTPAGDAKKLRVLLIDGQNNHDWRTTTPVMKKDLEDSGRFTVDVASFLKPGDKPGKVETVAFPPDLGKYDVIVSNYNGGAWPKEFNDAFDEAVKSGKVGLVIVHAANNAFGGWQDFNKMIGMGWRDAKGGDRLYLDDQGKPVRVPNGTGDSSGHRYTGDFTVTIRDGEHPVTKGMPAEWLHNRDELYDNMRGPIENVHMLATAYSKGTNVHEPMIWTVSYGKGRVFHTPMGHDVNAMRCVGFLTTLRRGAEWAATGNVTQPLPDNFPTAQKTSLRP